jgi:NADH-quinone oxidoreductase subunit H
MALGGLNSLKLIIAGWAPNSKYSLVGGTRSAAQLISYELSISVVVFTMSMYAESFDLKDIIESQQDFWYGFFLFPLAIFFFYSLFSGNSKTTFWFTRSRIWTCFWL